MERSDDALAQLLQVVALEEDAKLGLTHQENLEERPTLAPEVGEHPELFQRPGSEPLGFVDNKAGTPPIPETTMEKGFDAAQQGCLVVGGAVCRHAERRSHQAQQIVIIDAGRREPSAYQPAVVDQRCPEMPEHRRLAGTDFPRYDDEAFLLAQAIVEVRHRFTMRVALIKEAYRRA